MKEDNKNISRMQAIILVPEKRIKTDIINSVIIIVKEIYLAFFFEYPKSRIVSEKGIAEKILAVPEIKKTALIKS